MCVLLCVLLCVCRGPAYVKSSQLTLGYVSFLMRFTGLQMFLVMKMCVRDLG